MNHIFVAGAYFTTDKESTDIYPYIANILKERYPSFNVIIPTKIEEYRHNYITQHPKATPSQINRAMVSYDLALVKQSKMLIVDVSNKSTGLGIELGSIMGDNKKLVFIAKNGSKISNMVLGAFDNHPINYYSNLEELKNIILSINLEELLWLKKQNN